MSARSGTHSSAAADKTKDSTIDLPTLSKQLQTQIADLQSLIKHPPSTSNTNGRGF